jgi:hypothetical protein
MDSRIIRGVRVALPSGIAPASVHIQKGQIVALAGYDELPREACPEELGKSVLMPAFAPLAAEQAGLPVEARTLAQARRLAETWSEMRDAGEPIEGIVQRLCAGPLALGTPADFVVWNPELVVIDAKPVRYGQLRQLIVAGLCIYKDGVHYRG